MSALLLSRLRAHGVSDVVSVPTAVGVELAVLCADSAAARAFIDQVSAGLGSPITDHDDALPAIQEALTALHGRAFTGRAEAAVAECSGELGLPQGTPLPDPRTTAGRAELEKYRMFAFAARASAFAALGSSDFTDAVARELGKAMAWPTGDAAQDTWPASDKLDVDATQSRPRLSIALRVADADRALSSLEKLTASDADLSLRLGTFAPGFRLDRVAFLARPRGACLRVDLAISDGDPGPSLNAATQATSIVSEELRAALSSGEPERTLDSSIIQPSDPREAAARAAWRALTGRLEPGSERRLVALSVHPAERAAFNNFGAALGDFETHPARAGDDAARSAG